MTTCKHKLQKATGSGPGWQTWRCVDCRRSVIQTEDGKEQTLTELVAERADFLETYQHVIRENCAPDEQHCTCVPYLRIEIARMSQEREAAIDRNINNALAICNYVGDGLDYSDRDHIVEMAENIVNDLGRAYGISED